MKITKFFWIRHAPVKAMIPGRIYGQRDVGCNLKDVDRLKKLAEQLPKDALWITSSLSRTKKTAKAIAEQRTERPALHTYRELMEQNFGLWQSKTWDDLEGDPDAEVFWADPAACVPPDGESFEAVCARVEKTITHLTRKHSGETLICVAHAGTIRAAIAQALDITPTNALKLKIDTLSLSQIDHFEDENNSKSWIVGCINN